MPDLKKHYDRYLLAAAGLVLAGVAVLIAFASDSAKEVAVMPQASSRQEPFAANEDAELLKLDRAAMDERRAWSEATNGASTFVSRVYLLKDDRLIDIEESGNDLFPGIPNKWITENNLDYSDASLPERDPDEDNFTNFEEFTAKTNPRDPASKPPLWTKLRLTDVKIEKLRFTFTSLPTGSTDKVAINTITADDPSVLSGATQFYPRSSKKVRTPEGEKDVDERILLLAERTPDGRQVFQPTPFRFEQAEMTKRFNPSTNVEEEVPEAIILNTADEKLIRLELSKVKDSPYPLATFLDTRNGESRVLNLGEVLSLGPDETYKLIDVTVEGAKIQDLATKEQHTVPKAVPVTTQPVTPEAEQPQ
jgi:hypothetical protein